MKVTSTAPKMKFSITDFFSKYDQIRRKLRIWSHLLKKSVTEIFFCSVAVVVIYVIIYIVIMLAIYCYLERENCKVFIFYVNNSTWFEISTYFFSVLRSIKHRTLKL